MDNGYIVINRDSTDVDDHIARFIRMEDNACNIVPAIPGTVKLFFQPTDLFFFPRLQIKTFGVIFPGKRSDYFDLEVFK